MFRIAICDDKIQDLENLRISTEIWLKETAGVNGTVDTFRNPQELKVCLQEKKRKFDLYLLDIMMPEVDGIQLGRLIRGKDMEVSVIYVTSSSEYALNAYGIHAIRYLMKPVDQKELYSALNLAYALFNMRPKHTLLINGPDSVTSIIMEEVMYVENNVREITYRMSDGNSVVSVRRGGTFEEAVGVVASDTCFIQPHKSFFVNLKYIQAMQLDTILMDDGRKIPIARRRMTDIHNKYIRFISKACQN